MLAGSIDAVERLFMEQTCQIMLLSCLAQNIHRDLILVNGNVAFAEDWRQLKLSRCSFIVLCLGVDAKLPKLFIDIFHGAEVRQGRS